MFCKSRYDFTHGGQGLGYYLQADGRDKLRHANALLQLSEAERHALELDIVRANAHGVRDRDHDGDTQAHFSLLDRSGDNHLDDGELLKMLGPEHLSDPQRTWPELHIIRRLLVRGMKRSMDGDRNGAVHRSEFVAMMHPEL